MQPSRRSHRCRKRLVGNVVAITGLAALAVFLFRYTEGAWWLAAPTSQRWWLAAAVVGGYAGLCLMLWRTARREALAAEDHGANLLVGETNGHAHDDILIADASQTGFGEELARRTVDLLRKAGKAARASAIQHLDHERLARGGQVLFVASTTGQGDPPDHAARFVREVMQRPAALHSLQFGVLALGDRQYEQFCAFGRQLDGWLRQQQARPLFEIIEVDNADEAALQAWQTQVERIGSATNGHPANGVAKNGASSNGIASNTEATSDTFDFRASPFRPWRLAERRECNPGTQGGAAIYLALTPPAGETPQWIAGDIAEIMPRTAPHIVADLLQELGHDGETPVTIASGATTFEQWLRQTQLPPAGELAGLTPQQIAERLHPHKCRQYSIASLPEDGRLELLVRRVELPDGQLGLCSGWLCNYAADEDMIDVRIRSNPNFHPGDPARPMIFIGNGTGIAGLRSHLKAREKAGAGRNWLLFGERNARCDRFFHDDLQRWQAGGVLERIDLAYSRDQPQRIYVQHKLQAAADDLRRWIDDGAAVYVCGSLQGMAPAVDTVLRETLGESTVDAMLADGRYRRDVY